MKRFSSWAVRRPILFSVLFCVPVILAFLTLASVISEVFNHLAGWGSNGDYVGNTIGLVIGSVFLYELLRRFEWLDVVGLRKPQPVAGLFIVPPLLYVITVMFYVSSGTFDLDFSDPLRSSLITIRMLSTGLFEETAFRGVILSAMLLAWGSTKRGILKCFLISSLLFGMMHLINLLSRDMLPSISNAVYTCFTGALFAGVTLRCRSIWPAVLLHGMCNALLSLNRLGAPRSGVDSRICSRMTPRPFAACPVWTVITSRSKRTPGGYDYCRWVRNPPSYSAVSAMLCF